VKFIVIVIVLFVTTAMMGGTLYNFSDRLFTDFASMARH
jgi:type III secretion protein S